MARFARGGGEIDMLAARIARSATNRDRIAICGYHGWTDWYIGANYADKSPGGQALSADPRYITKGTGHGTAPTQTPLLSRQPACSHLRQGSRPWSRHPRGPDATRWLLCRLGLRQAG
jgi:hypothetical protein